MKPTKQVLVVLFLNLFAGVYSSGDTVIEYTKESWVYVPDIDGNFYWQDISDLYDPFFDPETDVIFYLFTRQNTEVSQGQVVKYKDLESLDASHYDKSRPTRFFSHGWLGNLTKFDEVIKPYLEAGDFNLFMVDWGKDAQNILYPIAAKRTKPVGKTVANFINFLFENERLNSYDDVILTGISLGAHVVGVAGKHTTQKVNTIYGLDPAGPLFFVNRPEDRFDRDDAKLTVAVRTNAGPFAYGFGYPLAHMEFMPNGGKDQPGCNLYVYNSCAHVRSVELFIEGLSSDKFDAIGCKSFAEVKENVCTPTGVFEKFQSEKINNQHGIYYFFTSYAAPFAMGTEGVPEYEMTASTAEPQITRYPHKQPVKFAI